MSAKKIILIVACVLFVVILPIFLITDTGLGLVQSMIDKNPQGSSAPWAQFTVGKVYFYTARCDKAVIALKKYIDAYKENKDRRWWDAKYYYALSLEECDKGFAAATVFREYLEQCAMDDPNRAEVRKECLRLHHHIADYQVPD